MEIEVFCASPGEEDSEVPVVRIGGEKANGPSEAREVVAASVAARRPFYLVVEPR
jgi:hypothetical protein